MFSLTTTGASEPMTLPVVLHMLQLVNTQSYTYDCCQHVRTHLTT